MTTVYALGGVDDLFTTEAQTHVPALPDQYRKPNGTSDQGWCED